MMKALFCGRAPFERDRTVVHEHVNPASAHVFGNGFRQGTALTEEQAFLPDCQAARIACNGANRLPQADANVLLRGHLRRIN